MVCEVTGEHYTPGCKCSSCEADRAYHREYSRVWNKTRDRKRTNNTLNRPWLSKARPEHKTYLFGQLGGRCAICGFQPIHLRQIDIHEINGRSNLGRPPSGGVRVRTPMPSAELQSHAGLKRLQSRIHELVPLCRNCHILVHTPECHDIVEEKIKEWRKTLPTFRDFI